MKNILVTGANGFIGVNLVRRLLNDGNIVVGIDNMSSSSSNKLADINDERFELIIGDICEDIENVLSKSRIFTVNKKIDEIYNLACPASPPRYLKLPMKTINVCTTGVKNVLDLARKYKAKVLHASTSEIYGDPLEHPQKETYRGNVNPVGPRSCYDEGKRIAETICYEYRKIFGVDIRMIRIFNTYGPYMDVDDGRVISNFINQAIKGEGITMYGSGNQTRSFQYIDDLIEAMIRFMNLQDPFFGPVNLGNTVEFTVRELAEIVLQLTESKNDIVYKDLPTDDPTQRKPDISLAKEILNWEPKVALKDGLTKTIEYFRKIK